MKSLLVAFLYVSTTVSAQPKYSLELEGGINSFGLRNSSTYGGGEEIIKPIIKPIFGLWASRSLSEKTFVSLGIQYSGTGERTVYYKDDIDPIDQSPYSVEAEEKLTFEKISLSTGVGYAFNLKRTFLKSTIGIKSVYYTTGSYEYHYTLIENAVPTLDINKHINPFNNQNLEQSADNVNFEIWIAVGMNIYKSFSVTMGFSQPLKQIYFEERIPNITHIYSRGDLSLTLSYNLRQGVR